MTKSEIEELKNEPTHIVSWEGVKKGLYEDISVLNNKVRNLEQQLAINIFNSPEYITIQAELEYQKDTLKENLLALYEYMSF